MRVALPVLVLAGSVGLVVRPAAASCAGATVEIVGAATTRAAPTSSLDDTEVVANVEREESATVLATNVTDVSEGCHDTASGGCDTVPPAMSAKQVALILQ